jgi:hypothetical protein
MIIFLSFLISPLSNPLASRLSTEELHWQLVHRLARDALYPGSYRLKVGVWMPKPPKGDERKANGSKQSDIL